MAPPTPHSSRATHWGWSAPTARQSSPHTLREPPSIAARPPPSAPPLFVTARLAAARLLDRPFHKCNCWDWIVKSPQFPESLSNSLVRSISLGMEKLAREFACLLQRRAKPRGDPPRSHCRHARHGPPSCHSNAAHIPHFTFLVIWFPDDVKTRES